MFYSETKDVVKAVSLAESLGIPKMSVVNAVGSEIARMTGLGVYVCALVRKHFLHKCVCVCLSRVS